MNECSMKMDWIPELSQLGMGSYKCMMVAWTRVLVVWVVEEGEEFLRGIY